MGRIQISAYVDEDLWHKFRIECLQRRISATEVISNLIEKEYKLMLQNGNS